MSRKCTKRRAKSLFNLLLIDAMRGVAMLTDGFASQIRISNSGAWLVGLSGRFAPLYFLISGVVWSCVRRLLNQRGGWGRIDYGRIGCVLETFCAATATHLHSLSDWVLWERIRCAVLIHVAMLNCGHFLLIICLYSFNYWDGRGGCQIERIDRWPGNSCCGGKSWPTEATRRCTWGVASVCRVTVQRIWNILFGRIVVLIRARLISRNFGDGFGASGAARNTFVGQIWIGCKHLKIQMIWIYFKMPIMSRGSHNKGSIN